jgi:hypothetical protein
MVVGLPVLSSDIINRIYILNVSQKLRWKSIQSGPIKWDQFFPNTLFYGGTQLLNDVAQFCLLCIIEPNFVILVQVGFSLIQRRWAAVDVNQVIGTTGVGFSLIYSGRRFQNLGVKFCTYLGV